MKLKFEITPCTESLSVHDPIAVATDLCDACEGFMQSVADLDDAMNTMDNIDNCIAAFENLDVEDAVATCNQEGALENLLGVPAEKITAEMALEGLGDSAKKAWDWFCEKVRQFWNWLCKLFGAKSNDLETKARDLVSTAQKVAVKVVAAKGKETPKVATVTKEGAEFAKKYAVPKWGDIDGLCTLTAVICDEMSTAGGESLESIKATGGTETAGTILKKFSDASNKNYTTLAGMADGVKVMTEHFEGEDKYSYRVVEIDYGKFLPAGKSVNYWEIGWTDANLKTVEKTAQTLRKAGKKCRELSGKLQHKADASENELKSITDAEKQKEARKVVQVIRIIAKQMVGNETIAGNTAGYHIECMNKCKQIADEVIKIATSK